MTWCVGKLEVQVIGVVKYRSCLSPSTQLAPCVDANTDPSDGPIGKVNATPSNTGDQAGELQRWQARARQLVVELERAAALNRDLHTAYSATVEAAEYNIRCLTEQIASLRTSTSWRITRPLRLARSGGRDHPNAVSLRPLTPTRPPPVTSSGNHPDAALILASGLFDEASYRGLAEARDMGLSPVVHYLMFGEAAGFLPSSAFDPSYYAAKYRDLNGKRAGGLAHYCRIGRLEGRLCKPLAASFALSSSAIDPRRGTILLAGHQAAGSDLPTSVRSIARELRARYNVVVMRQGGDPGNPGFATDTSDEIVLPRDFIADAAEAHAIARAIAEHYAPCYAITTCTAMQGFVRPFELAGIPTISVIDRPAADSEPVGTLDGLLQAASMVVFVDRPAAASMLARYPYLAVRCFTILDDDAAGVAVLDRLGCEARERSAIAGRGAELIRQCGSFGLDSFLDDPLCQPEPDAALWDYLHRSALAIPRSRPGTGAFVRRPTAGFHPLIYAEDNADYDEASGVDPFAHYLRAGTPAGRWQHGVIRLGSAGRPRSAMRILVHGHFHYPELLPEFLARLDRNATPFDLILTTTSDQHKTAIQSILAANGGRQARVLAHPNRGRDIGPLLTAIGQDGLRDYDLVGHLHGKRSPQAGAAGDRWRDRLWTNLAGGRYQALDIIAAAFSRDEALGLVFPADATLNDWDRNRDIADQLAARLRLSLPLPTHLDFPQGSMFWARPQALQPLFDLGLTWDDYPTEPLPIDGTLLHALERLIPLAVTHAGYRYATTIASP